jgi:competence protein CoiA
VLVALSTSVRIEARDADLAMACVCPECRDRVVLKKGLIKIPHFAHQPDASCYFGVNEGVDHLRTKTNIAEALRKKRIAVELEYPIKHGRKKMVSDLFVQEEGKDYAMEIVDTHDNLDHITEKSEFYKSVGLDCLWFPIVRKKQCSSFIKWKKGKLVYRPTAFEKWLLKRYMNIHFVVPPNRIVTCASSRHLLYVEETEWYEDGELRGAGGYYRTSKAFVELKKVRDILIEDIGTRRADLPRHAA